MPYYEGKESTVKELIEFLLQLPPDTKVETIEGVCAHYECWTETRPINSDNVDYFGDTLCIGSL